LHLSLRLVLGCLLGAAVYGQDGHDWQSGARLQAGDHVRVSLKTGRLDGLLQNWTPQDVKVGKEVARREDVLRIERYRRGGSHAKHIGIGALIGFGGGFAVGASVTGCNGHTLGPCLTRSEGGALGGGVGAIVGVLIGAVLPVHSKELIYSSK
jgi:hypothetical protein